MGKTPRKGRQHSFYERFGKATEPRVARTMHEPIHVGIVPADKWRPRCFWLNGELHRIYRVVKSWRDVYRNRWYRVKTEEGTFDLYEHRKWLSVAENRFRSYWYLAAEIEMVPVRHVVRATDALPGATSSAPNPGARDGRKRSAPGGSRSRRPQSPDSRSGRP